DGPTRGPSRRAGLGPRLCPPVPHRWFSRVPDGLADPLWAVDAAGTPPGRRATPPAALAAPAWAAVGTCGQDGAAAAPGAGESSGGGWHPGGRPGRLGQAWLADEHLIC